MRNLTFLSVVLLGFLSCHSNKINTEQEYFKWLSLKTHHLTSIRTINGLTISAKFLPPEYLVYNETKNKHYNKSTHDSLLSLYQRNRTFLLSFSPDEEKTNGLSPDIMYHDVNNIEEYNQRFNDLTFNIGNYIQLNTKSNSYVPVLHVFENTYGVSPYRSIYLVFGPKGTGDDLLTSSTVELVFNDLVFSTGINHFSFEKQDIDNIPHINFWKR